MKQVEMMEVQILIEILKDLIPELTTRDFINVNPSDELNQMSKLGICVDPTEQNIYNAVSKGITVLISYHPWSGEAKHIIDTNKIKIIPIHTTWDNHADGINKTFANAIGLDDLSIVDNVVTGNTDLLFRDLLERCQRVLDLNVIPYYGDLKFPVKKAAIWAGPGFLPHHQPIWEACLAQGCDTIISGELSLLPLRFAATHQLKLVDTGHCTIAKPGISHLAELLKYRLKALECTVEVFEDYYSCQYYTKNYYLQQFEPDESLPLFSLTERLE